MSLAKRTAEPSNVLCWTSHSHTLCWHLSVKLANGGPSDQGKHLQPVQNADRAAKGAAKVSLEVTAIAMQHDPGSLRNGMPVALQQKFGLTTIALQLAAFNSLHQVICVYNATPAQPGAAIDI